MTEPGRPQPKEIGPVEPTWLRAFSSRQVITPLVVIVILFAGLLFVLTSVFARLGHSADSLPENTLSILLITGTLALLVSVTATVVVFARLNLTSKFQPLGLPDGSIRAIIALLLILLFFISTIYLYTSLSTEDSDTRSLKSLTAEQVAQIPTADLVSLTKRGDFFDAELPPLPKDEASRDVAKQVITTVGTLVVAVSAFYFGANGASGGARPDAGPAGALLAAAAAVTEPEPTRRRPTAPRR